MRSLVFHDKEFRLYLGGSGDLCTQENDKSQVFPKDNS